ncbi:MAG: TIGR02391 family protein [bacterium]
MIDKYIAINRHLRAIAARCRDAIESQSYDDNGYVVGVVTDYIQRDVRDLLHAWPVDLDTAMVREIGQRVRNSNGKQDSLQEILTDVLPTAEDQIDEYFASRPSGDLSSAVVDLLHTTIFESSYAHFRAGRFRDAVFNAILAVFDLLRSRTGLQKDGAQLVAEALSLERPKLIISTLSTESGQSEQKGFIQILQGAYLGVRNPKAHSLMSDLDTVKAGQYLVFASLLARRIEEAQLVV